jgi:hypothetical protein
LVNNFILKSIPSEMFNIIKEINDISCGFWPYVRLGDYALAGTAMRHQSYECAQKNILA